MKVSPIYLLLRENKKLVFWSPIWWNPNSSYSVTNHCFTVILSTTTSLSLLLTTHPLLALVKQPVAKRSLMNSPRSLHSHFVVKISIVVHCFFFTDPRSTFGDYWDSGDHGISENGSCWFNLFFFFTSKSNLKMQQ
jgi:hypothetical protein